MYLIIAFIHLLFIYGVYSLGFYILAGLLIFLFGYFILYFSPVFFTKEKIDVPNFALKDFSLKNSLVFPMGFFYIALAIFLFGLLRDVGLMITIGIYSLTLWFLLFFGYMTIFEWKNDLFFDITRIHLVLSFSVVAIVTILSFFLSNDYSLESMFLLTTTILFWYFFFRTSKKESPLLFQMFLTSIILFIYNGLVYLWMIGSFPLFLMVITLASLSIFEIIPRIAPFRQFTVESRVLTLSIVILSIVWLLVYTLWDFSYVAAIVIAIIFLLSVHIRFSNYVAFTLAIVSVFFLYGNTFFSLLTETSLVSSLLYIFFLSFCIVGSTYFWEEKYQYDFSVLHYTSVIFSSAVFLYASIFLGWGSTLFFLVSWGIFLIGSLLMLSYFRFRYK